MFKAGNVYFNAVFITIVHIFLILFFYRVLEAEIFSLKGLSIIFLVLVSCIISLMCNLEHFKRLKDQSSSNGIE